MRSTPHFIDGHWVESLGGRPAQVRDPATGEVCAQLTLGSPADIDRAVAAARRAFEGFSRTSVAERAALLEAILARYEARLDAFAAAMTREVGCPASMARDAQAMSGVDHLRATLRALGEVAWEERRGRHAILREPIGVAALITPWNWPMNQIVAKVAPALAAGCTMVLKPSEEAPSCAALFAEVMAEAGVPAGVFNLVQGDGVTGEALAAHPQVDVVSFTGSTRAGIAVAQAAAPTVKRVHQELGGKAPALVLPSADLEAAIRATVGSVAFNSGQSCLAPTRLLVPAAQQEAAVAIARQAMTAIRPGDPREPGDHIGPLVNLAQWQRVQRLIASAIAEGATLEVGGLGHPEGFERGFYVRPTFFSGVTPDMTIAREEIFGPVVTVIAYADEEEAVHIANDTDYGLSAVVFGAAEETRRLVPRLRAGMIYVNGGVPDADMPFGGYKRSGNGREYGAHGIAEYLEVKSVLGCG
ncbi:aldehyde dehydrogenase family protein [Sphingomonas desiccabilis]|uniref:aldehyde dehydrogenase (NAD(+)) n=1 Tax=Sphingomonas desiccabilis TaxID=429134 RepID=A0A4Q2IZE8_9SPHN|nr:aldehyde dehydrogenase family protein [Sphingomonas desiccabilis]MBB3910191.1 aldehyde dehydrogenase (NAD+) [Sphingomonas desiccabilis]RXZ34868.1 aldehyde dehydrogenase family protein [Sphingomonas desiccabilis]